MPTAKDFFISLEELAKRDPVWRRVLEYEQRTPQIMLFSFLSRILDTRSFIRDILDVLLPNKDKLLARLMQCVPDLINNPKYWKQASVSDDIALVMTEQTERNMRERIDKHEIRIINQGLVNFCTIWDTFLESLLDSVLRKDVRILYGVAEGKNISLKEIVELASVETVIEKVRTKEVRNFSFEDIFKRFQYLETKIGIRTDEVFVWKNQTEEVQKILAGWNFENLEEIYLKRHSIVHRDDAPITSLSELETIEEFFIHMLLNLALLVKKKHGMVFDMDIFVARPSVYETFKKEQSPNDGTS